MMFNSFFKFKNKISGLLLMSMVLLILLTPTGQAASSWQGVVEDIEVMINQALSQYQAGEVETARQSITDAYFGSFEGEEMEQAVQQNIGSRNAFKVEYMFTQIKELMKAGASQKEVEEMARLLLEELRAYAVQLDKAAPKVDNSPFGKFVYSFLIIVREGFEAILVISAIIAYLIKSGNKDKLRSVYNSTFIAILASILTAIAFKYIFYISDASQEILEGVTMLLAMVVLFSVSFWLISKVEAKKWEKYIKGKVKSSLTTGSSFALWLAAFLAVYREGAETVLFYQALIADTDKSNYGMIGLGLLAGLLVLAIIYIVVRRGSIKLPLKPFFLSTSALMYYLTFVFAGKGIRELQEAGVIGMGYLEGWPTVSLLGIYPTWQSISLQVVLIIIAIYGLIYYFKQGRRAGT